MDKSQLLALGKGDIRKVDLGGDNVVYVRKLSISEQEAVTAMLKRKISPITAWIIVGLCDESGSPVFQESDAKSMRDMSLGIAKQIAEAVVEFNGLVPDELDDAEKN